MPVLKTIFIINRLVQKTPTAGQYAELIIELTSEYLWGIAGRLGVCVS
jgi:hypothetical protein